MLKNKLYRAAIAWRGPAYWHWRYYGWDYQAQLDSSGWQVRIDGRAYRFRTLDHWLPAHETVHILLSGPSVAAIGRPAALAMRPLIVVNGSHRILEQTGSLADLYLISDVGYVRRQWPTLLDGIRRSRAIAIDHRVALEIARRDPALLDITPVFLFDNLQRPYRRSARWDRRFSATELPHDGRRCAFSLNPAIGFFPSRTVAYPALQIAASQRPRRIVLFGLDLNDARRYYGEASIERSMLQQDLQTYIIPDFTLAASVLGRHGIAVLNASPGSALPEAVFPRIDPEDYLDNLVPPEPRSAAG